MNKIAKIAALAALALTCVASAACADFNADKSITVISREEGSGTRGAFVELTGVEQKIDGKKVDMTTADRRRSAATPPPCMHDRRGQRGMRIGYVSLGSLNDTVKAVKVDGVEATAENVKDGTYTICAPVQHRLLRRTARAIAAKDFVAYIHERRGPGQVINEKGYVATNATRRASPPAMAPTGKRRRRRLFLRDPGHGEARPRPTWPSTANA